MRTDKDNAMLLAGGEGADSAFNLGMAKPAAL